MTDRVYYNLLELRRIILPNGNKLAAAFRIFNVTRVGLVVIILLAGAGFSYSPWVNPLNQKLLDVQYRLLKLHLPRPARTEVVIVGIDESTVAQFPEPITLWHRHLARFLEAMTRAKPAAVGFDVVLPDRSFEAIVPGNDKALFQGIIKARHEFPLVLALTVDPAGKPRHLHPPFAAAAGAGATGYALLPVDRDGVVRRFDENLGEGGSSVPTLVGQLARRIGIEPRRGFIDFTRGAAFDYVPLQTVLAWAGSENAKPDLILLDLGLPDSDGVLVWAERGEAKLEQAFRGKLVLLGSVLQYEDRLPAPVPLAAWEDPRSINVPSVLLHAQTLRSILNGGLIELAPNWVVLALCLMMATVWFAIGNVPISIGVALGAGIALAGAALVGAASTWLLTRGWYLPPAAILITLALAVATRVLYKATLKLIERRRLWRVFSAYVSPEIMREILRGKPVWGLGGKHYRLCVLFADIRGFTTRIEGMTPEAVINLLNHYFAEVTASIHGAGGTLDKFIGDGVMAFFGAPRPLENPCVPAFRAARDMLGRVAAMNEVLAARGEPPIAIGIGLHAGDAVVGNVGSKTRHGYTAIGDTVNVASRLEGLTKEVDFPLVCSATVVNMLGNEPGFAKLGDKIIKGHTPVEVYGWRPQESAVRVQQEVVAAGPDQLLAPNRLQ